MKRRRKAGDFWAGLTEFLSKVGAFGAVTGTIFTEPDFGTRRIGRRLEKREKFLINVAQGGVVLKKRFVDFGQAFQDGIVGGEQFALLNESPHNKDTHRDGLRAVQDISRHDRAMLGEGVGKMLDVSTLRLQDRNLRS